MKKISILFTLFILLTAFTCEDEPIDQDLLDNQETDLSCQEASLNTADAALAFINNMASGGNYTALCSAYKEALENQILACGDPDGSIQQSIDALGDCIDPNNFTDCQAAENAVNLAQINFENASDDNYENLCTVYKTALENQIAECGDDGSIQLIIDELGSCENSTQEQSNWVLIQGDPTSNTGKYDAIHFKNSQEGFVGGGSLSTKFTTDGGETWEDLTDVVNSVRDFSFSSENNGWLAGTSGNSMKKTTDGGETWTSITPLNSNSLWGVAVDHTNDYAYFVGTGGVIWKYYNSVGLLDDISISGEIGLVTDIYVTQSGIVLAVLQDDGRIMLSDNGGISWAEVANFDSGRYTEITFPSENIGYAAGSNGLVGKTIDGGYSWLNLDTGGNGHYNGVDFYDDNHGIVVGAFGSVYYTNDGGATWSSQDIGNEAFLYDVRMLSTNSAIIIGGGLTIMKCDNIIF